MFHTSAPDCHPDLDMGFTPGPIHILCSCLHQVCCMLHCCSLVHLAVVVVTLSAGMLELEVYRSRGLHCSLGSVLHVLVWLLFTCFQMMLDHKWLNVMPGWRYPATPIWHNRTIAVQDDDLITFRKGEIAIIPSKNVKLTIMSNIWSFTN